MTNQLALVLGVIILSLIGADLFLNEGVALLFLGKKMFEFLDWLAFWR